MLRSGQTTFHQLLNYLSTQLQYRLDLSAVVGLFARNDGYRICQLNPCVALYTKECKWNNLDVLSDYAATIYAIEAGKDVSIKQITVTDHSWEVEIQQRIYVCQPFYARGPFGRMTRVLVAADTRWKGTEGDHLHLVKISFVDRSSRFREWDLYEKSHVNGFIRGLALCIDHQVANKKLYGVKGVDIKRTKCSLVLGSVGRPLSRCGSVLELLKIMYDAVVSKYCGMIISQITLLISFKH